MIKLELLSEPKVEFASDFLCEDPKTGISVSGFFSLDKSHKSEILYASIGTKNDIEVLSDWIFSLSERIEAQGRTTKIKNDAIVTNDGEVLSLFGEDEEIDSEYPDEDFFQVSKKLNPDFIGFNKNTTFKCEFVNDLENNIIVKRSDIDYFFKNKDFSKAQKVNGIIDLYSNAYFDLLEQFTIPDICYIVIPSDIYEDLGSIQFGKQWLNFRRKLKAAILSNPKSSIPVQIMLESTIKSQKKNMQDKSMIAWNFVVAQYYKTQNCIPWALTDIEPNTCFVGISFHKVLNKDNNVLRSSVAQAFNREGKGLIFMGKQFEWDANKTKVSSPHLKYSYAKELIINVLKNYIKHNRHTPSRVVIHKTTEFWDAFINKDYAETDGLIDGIRETLGTEAYIDLVTIRSPKVQLYRFNGEYPVIRGTLLTLTEYRGILYTTGYIPYFGTYPGVNIPQGLQIDIAYGDNSLKSICKEVLALTKLNFNNCNYYDSLPITLRFAQKVGEIIQYLPEGYEPPNQYYFYM